MTQHFLSLSPKTEKWNWQKEFVSFHEIECMYVPCKRIHSVSHMSNINGILLLFACHKEGFRPWIPITLKGLSINDIGNWEGEVKNWSKLPTDSTKNLPILGRGMSKFRQFADVVYRWSPNPTDIAHLEIMFFAQPNLAISPPILWSAENGSHEYLTDFIHFGIWFIWSAAWIFQLKKNMSFCVVTSKFCLVQALMLTVWTVKGGHSIVSIYCCMFLSKRKFVHDSMTTSLVKISEKALIANSGIKPNTIT